MKINNLNIALKLNDIYLIIGFVLTCYCKSQTFPIGHMSINFKDVSRSGGYLITGGIAFSGSGRDIGTEVYYPSTVAGNNQPVANGVFPVVIIGHGFVMDWSSYDNIYNQLASKGYIVLLPRTEGGFSPSHSEFGNDLRFLVNSAQNLNTISTPTALISFNGKVAPKSAIGGHSMGGGCSFLATAGNASVDCIFNFAAATTNPSSIVSAPAITVPALLFSGAIDCVADTNVQNNHYSALTSNKKFHVILKQITHCDFGNGTNLNCTFGQSTSGCANLINNTLAFPRYMNYLQNFLDAQLKNDCAAAQRFMDSINTVSSLRTGVKKSGSIACSISSINILKNFPEFSIYPNPSQSDIIIESPYLNFKINIFDTYGNLIFADTCKNNPTISIQIKEFTSGIYILELEAEGTARRFKIVKD